MWSYIAWWADSLRSDDHRACLTCSSQRISSDMQIKEALQPWMEALNTGIVIRNTMCVSNMLLDSAELLEGHFFRPVTWCRLTQKNTPADDLPFIHRVILLGLRAPQALGSLSSKLQNMLRTRFGEELLEAGGIGNGTAGIGTEELCPACQAVIPMKNAMNAVCDNGHNWRMSISLHYLSSC
jgi:hypothetical protein